MDAGHVTQGNSETSVLRALNALHGRLEHQLAHLDDASEAAPGLRALAADLLHTVDMGQDVALACILLNQIGGTYAVRHCIETGIVVAVVGRGLGLPDATLAAIAAAALTMNCAMLDAHDDFNRRVALPGVVLSGDERARLRRHPEDSARTLACAGIGDEEWLACVLHHHEDDDGSGYPHGLPAHEIPRGARLLRLADRYCARVAARNYRRSLAPDVALAELNAEHDPALRDAFHRHIGRFPPGTLVQLADGGIGVVTYRPAIASEGSEVACLRDAAGQALAVPRVHRLAHEGEIARALTEDEAELRFAMRAIWGSLAAR
ncbi:HD-GYP domain-containing protein [Pseudoduganella chitinolytica]|uniref:Metal-dependent phosphohydrolase n=1 Tax=Pseudoduganella chitinolytica TaxID=34070 RepID=A0ABY8BFS0_9BURK|nr:HD domain-containing phosphohydrolase [Pseudoduganella chitinolytica]WEF34772.1 metal-dependent phosphohydrolase [Pseudoduganella chitinolytica]